MATPANNVGPDTLVTVKVAVGAECRRFKLPLKELGPGQLPAKLRTLLEVPASQTLLLERFSDSAASYVTLSSDNLAVYKQLLRAAKAKLKLRIRATVLEAAQIPLSSESSKKDELKDELTDALNQLTAAARIAGEPKPTNKAAAAITMETAQALARLRQRVASAAAVVPFRDAPQEEAGKFQQPTAKQAPAAPKASLYQTPLGTFTVCCNVCSKDIPGAHWHCSICEEGDFDLCPDCVELGNHCDIDSHFLIKRMIENGRVINSSSERLPRKIRPKNSEETLAAQLPESNVAPDEKDIGSKGLARTCNCCVNTYDGDKCVTCNDCEDYDLCISCHLALKHGHHPGHSFSPALSDSAFSATAMAMCKSGRNNRHLAICDGCDKDIRGIRHKCLECPDFDFCSTCVKDAPQAHPLHRFVPVYEALPVPTYKRPAHRFSQVIENVPLINYNRPIHCGIRCDGSPCKSKTHLTSIVGIRYKCAVCEDFDLCANCEALPTNTHNRTHPMIKMRTAVQSISVVTQEDKADGRGASILGDRLSRSTESKSTETVASVNANASTQVADPKLFDKVKEVAAQIESQRSSPAIGYEALFERDVIPDGTKMPSQQIFKQTWTIRNPGPMVWPEGCCVHFVGGDRMLNIDNTNPASTSDLDKAVMSNIIRHSVAPNETVEFGVMLKAPERQGKAISYWRVKTPNGQAFGHKLWCEIDVTTSTPSEPNSPVSSTHQPTLTGFDGQKFEEQLQHKTEEIAKLKKAISALYGLTKKQEQEKAIALDEAHAAMANERASLLERLESAHTEAARTRQSQMIFPKLEKESPQSSFYENAPQHIQPELPAAAEPVAEKKEKEEEEEQDDEVLVEDVESLAISDEESTDGGFLTDEEYEILDSEFDELSQAAH